MTIRPAGGRLPTSLISGIAMAYNQMATAIFGMVLARFLGAADYGMINLARSIFAVAIVLSPFGLDLALQRQLGRTTTHGPIEAAQVFWPRLVALAVSLAVAGALLAGGARAIETHFYTHDGFAAVFAVTMAALPFATDLGVLAGAYRGLREPVPSILANSVVQPTARMVLIVALFPVVGGLTAVVWGTTVSYAVAAAALAVHFARRLPVRFATLPAAWGEARRIFHYAPLLGLGNFLFVIARALDVVVLGYFATTADVGRYAIALMAGQLVATVGISLGQTLGANIAGAAEAGDMTRIGALLTGIMRLASIVSAPLCVAISVWGADIDLLLGPSYVTAPAVFVLAALAQWIATSFNYGSWALVTTGRSVLELGNNVLVLIVQLVACFVLVPRFGIIGAAASTLVAFTVITVARQIEVALLLGQRLVAASMFTPMLISAIPALPIFLAQQAFGFRAWWLTGIAVILYFAVTGPLMLWSFRKADPKLEAAAARLLAFFGRRRGSGGA